MGGGGCHGDGSRASGSGREVERGRSSGSDWPSGRAAFSRRTCAVAARRGRCPAEARGGFRAGSRGRGGAVRPVAGPPCAVRGRDVAQPEAPLCGAGLSPPRRPPRRRRHCGPGPLGRAGAGSRRQVTVSPGGGRQCPSGQHPSPATRGSSCSRPAPRTRTGWGLLWDWGAGPSSGTFWGGP